MAAWNAAIGTYVILFPPGPPPTVQARVRAARPGPWQVAVASSQPEGAQFIWRLDGGTWSRPSRAAAFAIPHLLPGPHRLTVEAFNLRLEAAAAPARLRFTVPGSAPQRIARLLAQLAAAKTNAARQAIVRQLLRYPHATLLPALRRAGRAASPAEQWWLRAAAQAAAGPG